MNKKNANPPVQPDGQQPPSHKPKSAKTGEWGEKIAAEYLTSLGYAMREHNWRCDGCEIDIIAQRGTRMIFVEVKTRASGTIDPVLAVNSTKRRHMIRGADIYLRSLSIPLDYQFDIISIVGNPHDYTLEHIPDAFLPSPRRR